jgi:hypothetical protein
MQDKGIVNASSFISASGIKPQASSFLGPNSGLVDLLRAQHPMFAHPLPLQDRDPILLILTVTAFKALLDLPSGKVPIQSWADQNLSSDLHNLCVALYRSV